MASLQRDTCIHSPYVNGSIFPNNDQYADADLYTGGIFLGCSFGAYALYVWAVGLLAAGQSSTMTGTYAGQFVMEGFLNLQWPRWKRVLLTRTIAIVPTFCLAFFTRLEDLTNMNDFLNVIMSIQLPFATIPVIAFTSDVNIMGEFVNGTMIKVIASIMNVVVIGINLYFTVEFINGLHLYWYYLLPVVIVGVFYVLLCLYLVIHMSVAMGMSWLTNIKFIDKYVIRSNSLFVQQHVH